MTVMRLDLVDNCGPGGRVVNMTHNAELATEHCSRKKTVNVTLVSAYLYCNVVVDELSYIHTA